jgi:uncharacterized protein YjiS (DUF1127 family)
MAHITVNTPITNSFGGMFARVFSALGGPLVQMAESSSKMRQVNALMALSDAELAERGLKREDIAYHVFSESYWV